jgi:hypothetical protein
MKPRPALPAHCRDPQAGIEVGQLRSPLVRSVVARSARTSPVAPRPHPAGASRDVVGYPGAVTQTEAG